MLKLSVVTPTYNQAGFLAATIDSVLGQDYPAVEYLVLDDGSTDGTQAVLRGYGSRLHWTTHANRGQTATINEGWGRATGDVLAWINSDDTYLPGALSVAMEYLREHPATDIVYGTSIFTDAAGRSTSRGPAGIPFDYERFVADCRNPIPQPSAFLRRRVYEETGGLDPAFDYFMDWDLWLRAGLRHRIDFIERPLSTYRLHADSKTLSRAGRVAPELEYMYRKFFGDPALPAEIRRLEARAMSSMYFTSAGYYVEGGERGQAIRSACRAIGAQPRRALRLDSWHRLVYCCCGQQAVYRWLRRFARRR